MNTRIKVISRELVFEMIKQHQHWLHEDCEGWETMHADFSGMNLAGLSFNHLNLTSIIFTGADLTSADFWHADLSNADLGNTELSYANFAGSNLYFANLRNANLCNAVLRDANLRDASLIGAKNLPYIPMVCPEEGKFIGWKKAEVKVRINYSYCYKTVIVKLEIPASARRSSATSRKCRCDKAKVLEIYNLDGTKAKERKCYSSFDHDFIYEVGKIAKVENFNEERWEECSRGVHFFMNRQEAIDY